MTGADRDRYMAKARERDRAAMDHAAECRRHLRVKVLRGGRAVCPACEPLPAARRRT